MGVVCMTTDMLPHCDPIVLVNEDDLVVLAEYHDRQKSEHAVKGVLPDSDILSSYLSPSHHIFL